MIDVFFDQPIIDVSQASLELDSVPGVVAHGLLTSKNILGDKSFEVSAKGGNALVVVVGGIDGVRVALPPNSVFATLGELPWWSDKRLAQPLDRLVEVYYIATYLILNHSFSLPKD